jgi:hypothetical protein
MIHSSTTRPERLSLAHLTLLDATPLELIDAAQAGGFNFIGLRIVSPTPADPLVRVVGDQELIRRIERRLDETGIRILDVETFRLWPDTSVTDLQPALETAARLGARYLLVVGNDPDESRVVATFAGLCVAARPLGLKAMLEFIPFCRFFSRASARWPTWPVSTWSSTPARPACAPATRSRLTAPASTPAQSSPMWSSIRASPHCLPLPVSEAASSNLAHTCRTTRCRKLAEFFGLGPGDWRPEPIVEVG